jgi:FG-GAP-like repeat
MWIMVKASLLRRAILVMAMSVLLALIAAAPKASGQGPGINQSAAGDDATTVSFAPALGSPFAVGTEPERVASADFNRDRNPDLAVTNTASNDVTVLLGDGSGGFAPASGSPFAVGAFPLGITSTDFNRDKKPDLATANIASSNVTVLLNTTPHHKRKHH